MMKILNGNNYLSDLYVIMSQVVDILSTKKSQYLEALPSRLIFTKIFG
jgi:hypothetical protein